IDLTEFLTREQDFQAHFLDRFINTGAADGWVAALEATEGSGAPGAETGVVVVADMAGTGIKYRLTHPLGVFCRYKDNEFVEALLAGVEQRLELGQAQHFARDIVEAALGGIEVGVERNMCDVVLQASRD